MKRGAEAPLVIQNLPRLGPSGSLAAMGRATGFAGAASMTSLIVCAGLRLRPVLAFRAGLRVVRARLLLLRARVVRVAARVRVVRR